MTGRRIALLPLVVFACLARGADHPVNQGVKQSPRPGLPVPKFGWEGSAAYDPFNKLWIHHAGHDGNPQGFITFTCDVGTGAWRQLFPPTSPPGVCCVDGGNVFDTANRVFVRFPGGSLGHGYQWSRGVKLKNSAVWLYDLTKNEWTNMRPPPYGDAATGAIGGLNPNGAYDSVDQLAISFGGQGSKGGKSNLHVYDAYANQLFQMKPATKDAAWPSPRDGCGVAYDAGHEKLVLFGGQYTDDERTWVYDFKTNAWTAHDLTPRPPGLKGRNTYATIPKMTYDSVNGVVLCVVWLDENRGHETWALDVGTMTWTNTNAAAQAEPSKSRTRNLDFSAADNLAMMETWSVGGEPQLWTYRYKAAAGAPKVGAPSLTVITTDRSVRLEWSAVPGATAYRVERAAPGEPWKLNFVGVAEPKVTTYEDSGVTAGQAVAYRVRAVLAGAVESAPSLRVRAQPRVPAAPVVSVLANDRVQISWPAHPAPDVVGYNLYRGRVSPRTVLKGTPGAWKDNDPQYEQAVVTGVNDIGELTKRNDKVLAVTTIDDHIDLTADPPVDYRYAVYAYVVRAVNKLGVESGPSPYAMTIASEPTNVLCREAGEEAQLKWSANPEKQLQGYHVYKLQGGVFGIARVTDKPIAETTFTHRAGKETTRYWVVPVDALGQEGQPSSPAWFGKSYKGFYEGEWHQ
jgi:hypothetical protein